MAADELNKIYLHPTQEAGRKFIQRNISGKFLMLNLLRFKEFADYSETPELEPLIPISGEAAYEIYIAQTLPYLLDSGGEILFYGKAGHYLIGPDTVQWDCVMLIRQNSVSNFLAFNTFQDYLKITGHRTAALKDSRLLPIETHYTS